MLVVVALILQVAVAVPAANAATLPADGYIGTDGHGYGHGRGLGQWGAKGQADQGKTWTEILSHYYNATLATRAAETIRVLVEDSADVVMTSTTHPFSVYAPGGGTKVAESSAATPFLRAIPSGGGATVLIQQSASHSGPWTDVTSVNASPTFHPGAEPLGLVLSNGSVRYYRGRIEARRPSGSSNLLAINDLGIEPYLSGVVPREMPSSWDDDALRAQAVAARSYAAAKKDAARAAGKLYDICATTSCQVYGGYASASSPSAAPTLLERDSTNAAIEGTAGKVLLYDGKPILAEYSSSTGGHTAAGSAPYYKAVPDPADSVSPHHSWSTRVSVANIQNAWPSVGTLTDVRVTRRNGYGDWGGRVTEMVVSGTSGSVTISGGTFRSKMGLKSDWFRLRTYRAEVAGLSSDVSGPSGTQIPVSVRLRNTGTAEWRVGGSELLATSNPPGRASRFEASGWISESKAARIIKNISRPSAMTVGSGETAEIRFNLDTGGVAPGTYVEQFRPLADGITWFNDPGIRITVRVHSSWLEDTGNLLTNGSFEAAWSMWRGSGIGSGDGPAAGTARDGVRSMHLSGGGTKTLTQDLPVIGGRGRRFVLSGWSKTVGTSASRGPVQLSLLLRNTDGSTSTFSVDFAKSPHDWQYVERSILAAKPFVSGQVIARFQNQTGRVYFDAIRVSDVWLSNPSFEYGTVGWSRSGLGSSDGPSPNVFKDGYRSMHFGGGSKSLTQRNTIAGPAGRMYAMSGWTKATGANGQGSIAIVFTFNYRDGSIGRTTISAPKDDHGWTLLERHIAATKPFSSIDVAIGVWGQSGSIFFDGLRLRENRVPNGSFEGGLSPWSGPSVDPEGSVDLRSRDGARSYALTGAGGTKSAKISFPSGGSAGVTILVGAWNMTTASVASGGRVWMVVGFRNRDGTTTWRTLEFPVQAHDWMHKEMAAKADKAYSSIDIYLSQRDARGSVFFDGITLWAPA